MARGHDITGYDFRKPFPDPFTAFRIHNLDAVLWRSLDLVAGLGRQFSGLGHSVDIELGGPLGAVRRGDLEGNVLPLVTIRIVPMCARAQGHDR